MTMLESQYYNQALKFFVHEKRVPVKRILTEANISRSRFYAYLNGAGDLGMTRLLSILNVLHVNLTDFLMYARVLQEEACQTIGKKPTQQGLSRSEQLQIAAQVATQVHDYAPLVQVLRQIQQTVDYDEERAQIQPLLPLITGILCASTYRTATELALFLVVIPHLTYDQLQMNFPKAQAALTQRLTDSHDVAPYLTNFLVEMQYKMLMAALQQQDMTTSMQLVTQITTVSTDAFAWHAQFIKKIVTVIQAILQDQTATAKMLYSKLIELVYFIQPADQWLNYEKLLYHDFDHFEKAILVTNAVR
ncbi:XRE family transcriptional regulator [Leuconostoc lactis]|uniref:XRE family transcriptional regulator n=1 Tax=Leuconostoc lactis TaxID=1246 RepID=UPI0028D6607F|nr:XRE family transcriptional regulator [Leuconostoc lactis]